MNSKFKYTIINPVIPQHRMINLFLWIRITGGWFLNFAIDSLLCHGKSLGVLKYHCPLLSYGGFMCNKRQTCDNAC